MKELRIRPLDDRVVVEPVEAEERTAGGIDAPMVPPRKSRNAAPSSRSARANCWTPCSCSEPSVAIGDVVI